MLSAHYLERFESRKRGYDDYSEELHEHGKRFSIQPVSERERTSKVQRRLMATNINQSPEADMHFSFGSPPLQNNRRQYSIPNHSMPSFTILPSTRTQKQANNQKDTLPGHTSSSVSTVFQLRQRHPSSPQSQQQQQQQQKGQVFASDSLSYQVPSTAIEDHTSTQAPSSPLLQKAAKHSPSRPEPTHPFLSNQYKRQKQQTSRHEPISPPIELSPSKKGQKTSLSPKMIPEPELQKSPSPKMIFEPELQKSPSSGMISGPEQQKSPSPSSEILSAAEQQELSSSPKAISATEQHQGSPSPTIPSPEPEKQKSLSLSPSKTASVTEQRPKSPSPPKVSPESKKLRPSPQPKITSASEQQETLPMPLQQQHPSSPQSTKVSVTPPSSAQVNSKSARAPPSKSPTLLVTTTKSKSKSPTPSSPHISDHDLQSPHPPKTAAINEDNNVFEIFDDYADMNQYENDNELEKHDTTDRMNGIKQNVLQSITDKMRSSSPLDTLDDDILASADVMDMRKDSMDESGSVSSTSTRSDYMTLTAEELDSITGYHQRLQKLLRKDILLHFGICGELPASKNEVDTERTAHYCRNIRDQYLEIGEDVQNEFVAAIYRSKDSVRKLLAEQPDLEYVDRVNKLTSVLFEKTKERIYQDEEAWALKKALRSKTAALRKMQSVALDSKTKYDSLTNDMQAEQTSNIKGKQIKKELQTLDAFCQQVYNVLTEH